MARGLSSIREVKNLKALVNAIRLIVSVSWQLLNLGFCPPIDGVVCHKMARLLTGDF